MELQQHVSSEVAMGKSSRGEPFPSFQPHISTFGSNDPRQVTTGGRGRGVAIPPSVTPSPSAATTHEHRLGELKNRHLCLRVLKARHPRTRCWAIQFLVRVLSLALDSLFKKKKKIDLLTLVFWLHSMWVSC